MRITVGTDLSPASAGALGVALALSKLSAGADPVVLVHVADRDLDEHPHGPVEKARRELEEQAGLGEAVGIAVRTQLVFGEPDEALLGVAETEHADLIIVAAASKSGKLGLGTTASRLIAKTPVPTLVVRDPEPWLAFAAGERPMRLMLGIDDSATCALSIQWVKGLRALGPQDDHAGLEIVLGAIYYPDEAADYYGLPKGTFVDSNPEVERMMARDLLRRFGDGEHGKGVRACPRKGLGRIGDHMVELAKAEHVDVIVVGTSQKTGLGRLGSVSSVIVDDAPQSVVCVPPQAHVVTQSVPIIRTALVATDLSQFSNRAVPYAFGVVEPDGEVHIVHCVKDDDDHDAQDIVAQLKALVPVGAKQRVHVEIVYGDDAALGVAQCAARNGVDVICLASHGRSGWTRALVGSVADRLLRATRLPVLVLRPA
ncbi:MAG: universal stress protein [Deltaproteobacteria bacterium]|nr:universal stress protein [Deltaproteobacteria bacterium]